MPSHSVEITEEHSPIISRRTYSDRFYRVKNRETGNEFTAPSTYLKSFYNLLETLMDSANPDVLAFWGGHIKEVPKHNTSKDILHHPVFRNAKKAK